MILSIWVGSGTACFEAPASAINVAGCGALWGLCACVQVPSLASWQVCLTKQ